MESLYRGKRIDNGEWVYGNLIGEDVIVPKGQEFYIEGHYLDSGLDMYIVDPKTVGQYTDLKDKNDKKIFKGNIVKCYDEMFRKAFIGEVVYRSGSFCIKEAEDDYLYHFRWDDYECEVIGNIHDNPELLKGI